MIAFDLKCQAKHVFEAWFGSSSDYEKQQDAGLVECPICGDADISKAIMAPNIGRKGNQPKLSSEATKIVKDVVAPAAAAGANVPAVKPSPKLPKEQTEKLMQAIGDLQKQVEDNCDYVGKDFAEEARKIHYGEADERGIYGETTLEEAEELFDEGIDVKPIPFARSKKDLDA